MRQAVLLTGFAAIVSASPAALAIDFASINAAPPPTITGPPISANTNNVAINAASVAAAGSAAATGVASASATAPPTGLSKRNFWWPWGPNPWGSPPAPAPPAPSPPPPSPPPTTTTTSVSTTSSTTSSTSACPTTPEAGTYCGFINPEDPCAPQPDGYGPHVTPDTVEAFLAYPDFHRVAQSAQNPTGYAATFKGLNASVSANTYLGLSTLKSYDVPGCAKLCDNQNLCTGFNIFFERDPALNPSDNCTLPGSITNYKCTLWGSGVNAESATNTGGYRGQFQVVIAGSDGFEKTNNTTPAPVPGWQPPQHCGGDGSKVHDHPRTCIGTHFFPGPYNPSLCGAYAGAQNSINVKVPLWQQWFSMFAGHSYNPLKCGFFNSYMLKKNGKPLGTCCSLYAQNYGTADASYVPGWQGSDFWSIESSWSYRINGD